MEGARDLVVVTNGLDSFDALCGKPGITTMLSGGLREPRTGSLVGPPAIQCATGFLYDLFVCSGAAIDPETGTSEASLEEAEVKRAFASTSQTDRPRCRPHQARHPRPRPDVRRSTRSTCSSPTSTRATVASIRTATG